MNQVYSYKSVWHDRVISGEERGTVAPAIWSSILMAVAGLGDAILYAWLPVKGSTLGMSALTIGILLSVNKFVRFFTNRWVAYSAKEAGIRHTFLMGVLLSGLTTFIYSLNPATWIWVVTRIFWGFAYSALRFSSLQYAGTAQKVGSALGIGMCIQESGPLLAYWFGPVMLNKFGSQTVFTSLGVFIFLLIPAFYFLPNNKYGNQQVTAFQFSFPTRINLWILISSFAVEGLLIVGISKVVGLKDTSLDQLLISSALYISARRFLNMIVAPLSGWLYVRWGFIRMFNFSCLAIILGLLLITSGVAHAGVMTTFVGAGINLTMLPLFAIGKGEANRRFDSLTRMSSSRDIGSALGSLLGLFILTSFEVSLVFGVLTFGLLAVWLLLRKFDFIYG